MTHSSVLFVARFAVEINRSVESAFFVCLIMATNFLELATTLTNLGAKWLAGKKS